MSINIYKDELQNVWLFGQSVLYTEQPILREEVPEGWHCYDLRGTASDPKRPHELLDRTNQNFAGSILSAVPLMRGAYPKQAGPGQLLADRHPGHPDGLLRRGGYPVSLTSGEAFPGCREGY